MKNVMVLLAFGFSGVCLAAPFYWHGGEWGDFGTAANWTVGTSEGDTGANPESLIPCADDWYYPVGTSKIDLGGTEHSIKSASSDGGNGSPSVKATDNFTNGTLKVAALAQKNHHFNVWNGATFEVSSSDTIYFSWGGTKTINVYNGGRFVVNAPRVRSQTTSITVNEGGFARMNFTDGHFAINRGASSASVWTNRGAWEFPQGIVFDGTQTGSEREDWGAVDLSLTSSGTLLLGGNVTRSHLTSFPLNLSVTGGTLVLSNSVEITDVTSARISGTVIVDCVQDATGNLMNVTYGAGTALIKTGPGKLVLGDAAIPSLAVDAGTVEVVLDSVMPGSVSFATGTMLHLTTTGAELAPTSYDGMDLDVADDVCVAGATLLKSSDADFLGYAKGRLTTKMPAGLGLTISGDSLIVTATSAHQFDVTKGSDLSDPAAWGGTLPTADDDVVVSGIGKAVFTASSTHFKSMTLQLGATLEVTGGTEDAPVDLPAIELDYNSKLLLAEDAVVQMTNSFVCVGDADTLPVFEIATNALAIVQSPEFPEVKSPHNDKSYGGTDYGFRLKNVQFNWYGTLKTFFSDCFGAMANHCRLTLGFAADGETSYIGVDCRGGRYLAAGEPTQGSAKCRTPLVIATPDLGGRVVPVGTLLFRDYVRESQSSIGSHPEYATPGIFIGKCNVNDSGNPADVEYDVIFEGMTDLSVKGYCRIAGGAHVTLRGPEAKWRYVRTASNDEGHMRCIILYDAATLSVEDGALLDICATTDAGRGLSFTGTTPDRKVFSAQGSTLSLLNWSGTGVGLGEIDDTLLEIGYLRPDPMPSQVTPVFAGLKSVELKNTLTVAAADVDQGNPSKEDVKAIENWNRLAVIGPALTGTGSLAVSNELAGAHASYSMTVVVSNGANTATGTAKALPTDSGAVAELLFDDGANWAGKVVADGHVALTNLSAATAATVSFDSLELKGVFPLRVWKTGGAVAANDKLNVATAVTGAGTFELVDADEPLATGDVVELGTFPRAVAESIQVKRCTVAARSIPGDDEHMTVIATRGKGLVLIFR